MAVLIKSSTRDSHYVDAGSKHCRIGLIENIKVYFEYLTFLPYSLTSEINLKLR